MPITTGGPQPTIHALDEWFGTIVLEGCSDPALARLVSELHDVRRRIDGHLARIATEARRREESGAGSTAGDLFRGTGQLSRAEADRLAKRGEVADTLPKTAAGMHAGRALTENMDTLTRMTGRLSGDERARLAALDSEIAERAELSPPEVFRRWLGRCVRSVTGDDEPSAAERQKLDARLNLGRRADGMWWLSGLLDPERGAELQAAVQTRARRLAGDLTPTNNTRAASLHQLVMGGHAGGSAGTVGGTGGPRLGIGYVIDAKTLAHGPHEMTVAQTWAGDDHDPRAVQRLACDADWFAVLLDQLGHPKAAGHTRRAASRDQRLALRSLYRCCPLDGTPFDGCEIHHVNFAFEEGGSTTLDNLLPLSTAWHHRIHDRGWSLTMADDRSLELCRPNGQLDRRVPPPMPITRQRE